MKGVAANTSGRWTGGRKHTSSTSFTARGGRVGGGQGGGGRHNVTSVTSVTNAAARVYVYASAAREEQRARCIAFCNSKTAESTETAEEESEQVEGSAAATAGGEEEEEREGEGREEEDASGEEEGAPSYKAIVDKVKEAVQGDAEGESLVTEVEGEFEAFLNKVKEGESQLAAAQEESLKIKEQYLRLNADFDNYRKRTESEKESLSKNARGSTLEELLPVIDNFELARTQLKLETEAEQNVSDSYQNLYKQLVETLKKLGLETIESVGTKFDPELHDAIMQEETNEHEDSTVLEEYRRGFTFESRLLRAAMVKVAVAASSTQQEEEKEEEPTEEEE
mmetsp:Transcript_5934/g.10901  ORF Transcript_5934/g.10901 Transcript_5934/m.10901 type:complete len:338 (-) Transcript_5934:62-1075(-)